MGAPLLLPFPLLPLIPLIPLCREGGQRSRQTLRLRGQQGLVRPQQLGGESAPGRGRVVRWEAAARVAILGSPEAELQRVKGSARWAAVGGGVVAGSREETGEEEEEEGMERQAEATFVNEARGDRDPMHATTGNAYAGAGSGSESTLHRLLCPTQYPSTHDSAPCLQRRLLLLSLSFLGLSAPSALPLPSSFLPQAHKQGLVGPTLSLLAQPSLAWAEDTYPPAPPVPGSPEAEGSSSRDPSPSPPPLPSSTWESEGEAAPGSGSSRKKRRGEEQDKAPIVIRRFKTPGGVRVEELVVGSGELEARPGDMVSFHYVCRRSNGYFVSSTVDPLGKAVDQAVMALGDRGKMIQGLSEAMEGMRAGGKRRALIPPEAGYTSPDLQPLPEEYSRQRSLFAHANEPLVFELQLLNIRRLE